jgi:TPR repeat protein
MVLPALTATGCIPTAAMIVAKPLAQATATLAGAGLATTGNDLSPKLESEKLEKAAATREKVRWAKIEERARAGDVEAQYQLATGFHEGTGRPLDPTTAMWWYRKAAERNHGRAQIKLGLLHEKGLGVPQDPVQAYMWYTLALSNGLRWVGPAYRENLASTMNEAQIAKAEQMAWEWMQAHPVTSASRSG